MPGQNLLQIAPAIKLQPAVQWKRTCRVRVNLDIQDQEGHGCRHCYFCTHVIPDLSTMEKDQVQQAQPRSSRQYFTRSKLALEYKAAGVLPFCILPCGEALVLLGAEDTRTGPQGRMRKTMCKDSHIL